MKVIQFCPDDQASSGVNTFCTKLNEHLCELGIDSHVLRTFDPTALADLIAATPRHELILHFHEMWLPQVHRAAVWARKAGAPIVWSTHGMTAPWALRHKWWKKWPAWRLYQKRDLRSAVLIHCTSEQEVGWNGQLGLKNCMVAPLGTELGGKRSELGVRSSEFRVLFVGRIHPVKGLLNLVRAAALLQGMETGGRRADVRLVGPDQAGHMAELQAECAWLGVRNVAFAGEKHGAELAAEYDWCDVLVLPSFTENFGGVVVDALARLKPVIASRFTPWGELEEKGCGWWVDNTPESLAKTIAAAAALPRERLAEMGGKGRALVEAKYTWRAVAKAMAEGYERVLGSELRVVG